MTDEIRRNSDRRAAAWLEEGPTAAPDALLPTILDQASHTSQRTAWAARLLGAPAVQSETARQGLRLAVIVVLVALVSVLGAVLLAGALQRNDQLVVAPSASPRPSIAPDPTSTPDVPSATPAASPAVLHTYERADLGFSVDYDPNGEPPEKWYFRDGPDGVSVLWGTCPYDLCQNNILISTGTASHGAVIGPLGDPDPVTWDRIKGSTIGELEASWTDLVGPSHFEATTIDGADAFSAEGPGHRGVVAIRAGRVFALTAGKLLGGVLTSASQVQLLIAGFHFVDPAQAYQGEARTYLATDAGALFGAVIPSPGPSPDNQAWRRLETTDGSVAFQVAIRITQHFDIETTRVLRIGARATSLDDARAVILAERGGIRVVDLTVGGDPAVIIAPRTSGVKSDDPLALVEHGGLVYTIRVSDLVTPGAGEDVLRRFLLTFQALGSADAAVGTYRDSGAGWQFVPAAVSPRTFNQQVRGPDRVTFASCPRPFTPECGQWVTVVSGGIGTDVAVPLFDGTDARFAGSTLTQIAAAWETVVGRSRGSSTVDRDGALVFQVDNTDIAALFTIRDGQWLAVVAFDRGFGGNGSPYASDVLARFLVGFDFFTPRMPGQ